ncbi:MAG: UDP-N-acetylglucosamine 2-epimerase (non-hydrolyzing) [bacterium]
MEAHSKKLKIATIFGTRPEIIRLSRILPKFDEYVDHITVHTGQSFDHEMSAVFFEELGLREPNYYLDVKSDTLGKQIANIVQKTEEVLLKEQPDAVLILGDTNSALSAINAKRMKIPIFHMEAGNRCFDERVPEEINRKIVDHISDINLPYTEHARRYLLLEGIKPGNIYVTGSPLAEVLAYYQDNIDASPVLQKLKLKSRDYFLVSMHREENVDAKKSFAQLINALNKLAEEHKIPLIVTTHPRTKKRIEEYQITTNPLIRFAKPFGYFDYIHLQQHALCVISDSGTIPEESALLQFPAVQIRASSERPEAFDAGTIILTGLESDIITQAVHVAVDQRPEGKTLSPPLAYTDMNVSSKVLRLVLGLAKIVKRKRLSL